MRSLFKKLFVAALVGAACASAGLLAASGGRPGGFAIRYRSDSVVLKKATLVKASGSTVLKGEVVNNTGRSLDGETFEVRAYDRVGNLLKGVEKRTIFSVGRLGPHASARVNSGYGVWLQGIPREAIASIELYEADAAGPLPAHAIPLADQALFWKEYSEIEE